MSLMREGKSAISWSVRVLGHFLRQRFGSTLMLALCIVGVQITTLLAFFLPLKILILAGSDGVPRYFRFFMDPNKKDFWIFALSLGAIVFYVASLALDRLGKHLSRDASGRILAGANEVAVTTQLREDAKGFYIQFVRMFADCAIFVIGVGVIAIIYWPLAATILFIVLTAFLIVAALSLGRRGTTRDRCYQWIVQNIGEFLNLLYAISFLSAFFVLLAHFILGPGMNILVAILTVLIMRQGLKGGSSAVTSLRALWLTRPRIDPLVFRSAQVGTSDRPVGKEFREVFARDARANRVESALTGIGVEICAGGTRFRDVPGKNLFLFELHGKKAGEDWFGLQRVFSQDRADFLEHEEFLFRFVSRSEIGAPPVVSRYVDSGFYCQILECGPHEDSVDFADHVESLLGELWAFQPPAPLVEAYQTSHRTLEGRLTDEFLLRMEVAADDAERKALLDLGLRKREEVCQCIRGVPLHIMNPDASPHNLILKSDFRVGFWNWQRWSIEHLGAFVPGRLDSEGLERILQKVRQSKCCQEEDLSLSHIELVSDAVALEKAIVLDQFCAAFDHLGSVVRNSLISG